ncbi:Repeat domain-containing protein [Jiangella alba]|uniref:Repeat domain-containing protein n=1 Tax=Jiangella alba TaxID=561176 RepID=A0A1H5JE86_9ACTN|nr:Repeat domain-containing protein [Jiangella alba]
MLGGDFNGDDRLDIGLWSNGVWTIRYGDGAGAFGNQTTYTWTAQPGSRVLVEDYNGDGKDDIGVWQSDGSLFVRYGHGDGQFGVADQTQTHWAQPPGPSTAGDYDGDGLSDLAAWTGTAWSLRRGTGSGTFTAARTMAPPPGNGTPLMTDVDGDGRDDLVVWAQTGGEWTVRYNTTPDP